MSQTVTIDEVVTEYLADASTVGGSQLNNLGGPSWSNVDRLYGGLKANGIFSLQNGLQASRAMVTNVDSQMLSRNRAILIGLVATSMVGVLVWLILLVPQEDDIEFYEQEHMQKQEIPGSPNQSSLLNPPTEGSFFRRYDLKKTAPV
ncbi:unnamed protein product [Sphagnum balticum]